MREERQTNLDLEMTQSAAAGYPSAERALLDRVWPRVYRTCRCLCGQSSEVDDLAQLALVEVIRSAGSFRAESSLEYWVDRITVQTAAKEFRKSTRRKRLVEGLFHPGPVVPSVDDNAALSQLRDRLLATLGAISPKYKTAVVMHYLYDYEVSEIAELTGTNLNTVRGHLRRGLRKLRAFVLADPVLREWIEERIR